MFPVVAGADAMTVKKDPQWFTGERLVFFLDGVGQCRDETVLVVVVGVGDEQVVAFLLGQEAGLNEDVFDRGADRPAVGAEGADFALGEPAGGGVGVEARPGRVGEQIDGVQLDGVGRLLAAAPRVGDVFETGFRFRGDAEIGDGVEAQFLDNFADTAFAERFAVFLVAADEVERFPAVVPVGQPFLGPAGGPAADQGVGADGCTHGGGPLGAGATGRHPTILTAFVGDGKYNGVMCQATIEMSSFWRQ